MPITPEGFDADFDTELMAKGYIITNLSTKDKDNVQYRDETRFVRYVKKPQGNTINVDVFVPDPKYNPNGEVSIYINGHLEEYQGGKCQRGKTGKDTPEESLIRAEIQEIIEKLG